MSSFTWEIIGLLVIMLPFWLFYRALQRAQKSAIALTRMIALPLHTWGHLQDCSDFQLSAHFPAWIKQDLMQAIPFRVTSPCDLL